MRGSTDTISDKSNSLRLAIATLLAGVLVAIAVLGNLHARTIMLVVGLCQLPPLPSAVRGGLIGAVVGLLGWYSPGLVGMAVALATIARAPFTGILLAMETTGAFIMALPMVVAVFGAVAVIQLLHTPSLSHGLEAVGERLRELRERPDERG